MTEAPDAPDDTGVDAALVAAAFALAGEVGWSRVSVAEAARRGGVTLGRARERFAGVHGILARFGRIADQAALAGGSDTLVVAGVRDQLFDILMRRLDVLQAHRQGMMALLRVLPFNPPLAAILAAASLRSMRWMLEAAGVDSTGPRGTLRAKGLLAVWLWTVRAWQADESEDMSATMSALDTALERASQVESWLGRRETTSQNAAPDAVMEEAGPVLPTDGNLAVDLPRSAPPPPPDAPASPPA